jgi:hypothetical protein
MSFSQFMEEQMKAIRESGLTAEEWIERNAEEFRQTHEVQE